MKGYTIRRSDGKYLLGYAYGGAGKPVPYYTTDLKEIRVYRTPEGAVKAAARFGGHAGAVELDGNGLAVRWTGFLIRWRDEWIEKDVDPLEFDPNDYQGNNGPLG